jgi:hypothetical protein
MAGGALSLEQCRAALEIGRPAWRHGNGIRRQDRGGQGMRALGYNGGRRLVADHCPQFIGLLDEARPCCTGWQLLQLDLRRPGEFLHFGIFAGTLDAPVLNRLAIVDRQVIEQLPHLFGLRLRIDAVGPGDAGPGQKACEKKNEISRSEHDYPCELGN